MREFCIYVIHNVVNNKVYVGKTNAPAKRWRKHIEAALSSRKDHKFYLHRAIKKYGVDSFVFTVLQRFSNENEQSFAEKYWIQYFHSRDNKLGYNLTDGGEGCIGRVTSQSTKDKISTSLMGHMVLQGTRNSISSKLTGLKKLQDFKHKISKSRTGTVHSQNTKIKLSVSKLGELNPHSKLNEEKVKQIRSLFADKFSVATLSKIFDVSAKTIKNVVNRVSWQHVR